MHLQLLAHVIRVTYLHTAKTDPGYRSSICAYLHEIKEKLSFSLVRLAIQSRIRCVRVEVKVERQTEAIFGLGYYIN